METFKSVSFGSKFLIAAGALAVCVSALPAPASAAQIYHEKESVTHYRGWDDPVMADLAVNSGRALLGHLQNAETMLKNGEIQAARSELASSDKFSDAIHRMMPYVVVADQIRNAKHKLVDSSVGVFEADLLPIYASLDEMEVYAPKVARRAHTGLGKAVKHARAGNKKAAARQLQNVADDITASTVYIPVDFVQSQIRAAETALNKSKPDVATAKKAVKNALGSLITQTEDASVVARKK